MTTWFSSDLHFGHANIIEYCGRPFSSVRAMDEWLISAWNDTVAPGDDVWVLGDVAMGNLNHSLRCVGRLQGTLRLVAGNHDKPFRRTGVARPEWEERYRDAGFTELFHGAVDLSVDGVPVTACHFPRTSDPTRPDRFAAHRPAGDGWLLHGHVHGRWVQRGRSIDVGVDAWGGRPVDASTLAALLAAGPADRDPLPWGIAAPHRLEELRR